LSLRTNPAFCSPPRYAAPSPREVRPLCSTAGIGATASRPSAPSL
jgi:hypothetical protein